MKPSRERVLAEVATEVWTPDTLAAHNLPGAILTTAPALHLIDPQTSTLYTISLPWLEVGQLDRRIHDTVKRARRRRLAGAADRPSRV